MDPPMDTRQRIAGFGVAISKGVWRLADRLMASDDAAARGTGGAAPPTETGALGGAAPTAAGGLTKGAAGVGANSGARADKASADAAAALAALFCAESFNSVS